MNIETLDEFAELAKNLSFTKTAQMFNVTQSALSKHILALEKEFDTKLFMRNQHGVCLTEDGRLLFERALGIITLYKDAHAVLASAKAQPPITVCGDMNESDITPLLSMTATIMRNSQHRSLVFNRDSDFGFLQKVANGKVDVAVGFFPQKKVEEEGLRYRELFSLPLLAIMGLNNALASASGITLEQLKDETLLRFAGGFTEESFEQILDLCRSRGFEPKLRSVNVTSRIEFFSTPLMGSILLWKVTDKEIGFQKETGLRAFVPIVDEDARLKISAAYQASQEEHLQPFFKAFEEGLALMRGRKKAERQP